MADFKVGRLSSDIQRIISGKLRDLKDPRVNGSMLTVVKVDVSCDKSVARVYISSFEGIAKAKEAVKGLESASGFLKREIANVLHIRKCPELRFVADDSTEYSAHIAKVIKDLNLKYDDDETEGEEE
ncbi:MAG: 30S ribosome-binding factor RbfA [Oscillospiraceae bacterium]|nr:30S ribosome-binding factor RbfA [Oscillospiraceae bacterium]